MFLVGSWSAARRREVMTLGLAAALCAVAAVITLQATPPVQDQHAAFRFGTDAGMVVWQVPEAKIADFEAAWSEIMSRLAGSEKPELKELGASIKIYRPNSPTPGQPVSYFILGDPPSKTLPYSPVYIVYESGIFPATPEGRAEADALWKKLPIEGEGVSISALPLKKLGAGAGAAPMAPAAPPPASAPPTTTTP
jgi:hypothetical protein